MRLVVTGASGNLGTALLRRLSTQDGCQVTAVARRPPVREWGPYQRARWLSCDLGDAADGEVLARALRGADAVVHLAWAIHPRRDDPPMWRTNTAGTRRLLRLAAAEGVPHVVVASSVAAYSPAPRWVTVTEDWSCGGIPDSAYSRGKAWLEAHLEEFAAANPSVTTATVRPCAIVQKEAAGQFSRWLLSALVPEQLLGRPWLVAPLWRRLRVQLVHADDVAAAVQAILRKRAAGAFNLAAEPILTAPKLAEALGAMRLPTPRSVLDAAAWLGWRAGLQPLHPGWLALADQASLVDVTRAVGELGWRPQYDAFSALGELVAGMRSRAGGASAPLAPQDPWHPVTRLRSVSWGRPSHQSQA